MVIIANERKTQVFYDGNGTQKVYAFPFDYLRKAFVKIRLSKGNQNKDLVQGNDYTVNDRQVTLAEATDWTIKIYRETTTIPLVSWADASVLMATDMTVQEMQLLHLQEETSDRVLDGGLAKDTEDGLWDARYTRIKNLNDPVNPGDAVTLRYLTDKNTGWLTKQNTNGNEWIKKIDAEGAKQVSNVTTEGTKQTQKITDTGTYYHKDVEDLGDYYLEILERMKIENVNILGFDPNNYYTKAEIDSMEVSDDDILALFDGRKPVTLPTSTDYEIKFATDLDMINLFK